MTIRNAKQEDIPRILEIYAAAVQALGKAGIDQWQNGYPNEASALGDIENGIGRVCEDGGAIIATAAAYIGHEPTYDKIFEGAWLTDCREYGIVHRIAVSPEFKNGGVASKIMQYTLAIAQNIGVKSLRCDTHRHNLIMQNTLRKNGFTYCGIIYLEDGNERLAFERLCK